MTSSLLYPKPLDLFHHSVAPNVDAEMKVKEKMVGFQ